MCIRDRVKDAHKLKSNHRMRHRCINEFGSFSLTSGEKADCTRRSSQAVPHPSTNRALCRLTSEVRRDPVHSTRYGRQRGFGLPAKSFNENAPGCTQTCRHTCTHRHTHTHTGKHAYTSTSTQYMLACRHACMHVCT